LVVPPRFDVCAEDVRGNFNPHVSTGVALKDYLDKMLAEPFESFTFLADGCGRLPARPVRHGGKETQRGHLSGKALTASRANSKTRKGVADDSAGFEPFAKISGITTKHHGHRISESLRIHRPASRNKQTVGGEGSILSHTAG
jgi:hypothetical protein